MGYWDDDEHKTLPPDRDLAAELDTLARDHAEFAATMGPLLTELRMMVESQNTTLATLRAELQSLRMSTPVVLN